MHAHRWKIAAARAVVVGTCLGSAGAVLASECLYHAIVPDTRVVSDAGAIFDPQDWLTDPRCERLSVATGRVRVARHELDGRIVKIELGARARLAPARSESGDPMLGEFQVMLAGDQRVRDGRARSAADGFDAVTSALPHGKIVHSGAFEETLPLVSDELGAIFTLTRDGGAVLFTTPLRTPALVIPENILQVGQRYNWTFKVAGQTLRGTFAVVDLATRDTAVRNAVATSPDVAAADPLLFEATTLRNEGYDIDARRKMREWLDR